MPGFTHLHCHSEYSLLDGLARVPDLVDTAVERGFDALALTDHGVMFGALKFYRHAVRAGIKPILGCEFYVAARGRGDRDHCRDRARYHLTVLAENAAGYRNLMALASRAQLEGFYYKPRIDRELLEQHAEGLIVLSGCASSEIARAILDERMPDAVAIADWYRSVFPDRYYIEMMVHDIDFIPRLNRGLREVARQLDLPVVATNDVHYCRETDVPAHEVLLCVQTSTTVEDPSRLRIGDTFYMRTEAEMRSLFAEEPGAVDRTAEVAERCDVKLEFENYKLPRFPLPDGETAAQFLHRLCREGIAQRYPAVTPVIEARLMHELAVIGQMGFDDYFLIVWDLCRFAADNNIWWNVRGSGAGSIVAYALRITNIDPMHHQLIFERFLNPSRVSMPDIDLDFPDDQRDRLIRYTFERYGHDRVAQIITFGTMGARAAIRDAGRALAMPLPEVDRVARLVPAVPGKACGIDDALRPADEDGQPNEFYAPDLAALRDEQTEVRRLLDTARSLEGVVRHASTHAAGVVISDRPLVDYLPLHRPTRGGGDDGDGPALSVTQFDMNDVEALGLLKVDFLGLATLTVLRRAADLIERHHGVRYSLDNIPLDDPVVFELLGSGEVTGVFQVEGAGMRRMLREMRPTRFEHVVAAIALYRPGPMEYIPSYIARMHGREEVGYRHPRLEPILAETFGIIVYQEQIIRIARDLAGYDAGEADTIRKAVGKKNKKKLLEHRQRFVAGAKANGIPARIGSGIFDDIETFARYGFNKAHAADYAVIVCQTAYFKAKYPVEYAAALLSVERDDTDKIAVIAADCRRLDIALLPPCIQNSHLDFAIEHLDPSARESAGTTRERAIRFGLGAIKNVGEGAVLALLEARADKAFADLDELCRRADMRAVGKRAIESLIKAGALDVFGPRACLLAVVDRMVSGSGQHHQAAAVGQLSLFGDTESSEHVSMLYPLPQVPPDRKSELLWERELIGLFLSDHPLRDMDERLASTITARTTDLTAERDGQPATMAGLVAAARHVPTRRGSHMAFVTLEDMHGSIEVVVFPSVLEKTQALWSKDSLVIIEGRVEIRGGQDRAKLIADSAYPYDPADFPAPGPTEDGVILSFRTEPGDEQDRFRSLAGGGQQADGFGKPDTQRAVDSTTGVATADGDARSAGGAGERVGVRGDEVEGEGEGEGEAVDSNFGSPDESAGSSPAPTQAPLGSDPKIAGRIGPGDQHRAFRSPPSARGTTPGAQSGPRQPAGTRDIGGAQRSSARSPFPRGCGASGGARNAGGPHDRAGAGSASGARGALRKSGARYTVEVTLPLSVESAIGIQALSDVYQTLVDYGGNDAFVLLIPSGNEMVVMEFPNHRTRYCVELLDKLRTKVGAERINVRPTAGG